MKYSLFFLLLISNCFYSTLVFAQNPKPLWMSLQAGRSFATSGDYYGLMTGVSLEKATSKNGMIGLDIGFNMHSEVANALFVIDSRNPAEVIDMSYWRAMSGLQVGAFAGRQHTLAQRHILRTDIGPFIRLQFNSNDGFGVYYPPVTDLPFPVYSFENSDIGVKRTTFGVGVKGVLQYRYLISEKWQIGLHASAQTDSQGDNFYNYGLMFATRFLR